MIPEESQDEDADGGSMMLQSFTEYGDLIMDGDNGQRYCAIWPLNTDLDQHRLITSPTMDHVCIISGGGAWAQIRYNPSFEFDEVPATIEEFQLAYLLSSHDRCLCVPVFERISHD